MLLNRPLAPLTDNVPDGVSSQVHHRHIAHPDTGHAVVIQGWDDGRGVLVTDEEEEGPPLLQDLVQLPLSSTYQTPELIVIAPGRRVVPLVHLRGCQEVRGDVHRRIDCVERLENAEICETSA